ncbi:MAG: cysteine desulfurase [Oscillospiraceae bacterium]|nr:cysteine desulfurase [Oscillospiraceae bacterium]
MIYADCAATTPVSEAVLAEMMPYFTDSYGNPSTLYKLGRNAGSALETARERIAAVLGCHPAEIFFTSCGTESDNWALTGTAKAGHNIVTTSIEHHAVLHTCDYLEKRGMEIRRISPDSNGIVPAERLISAMDNNTTLVSVMYANNEVGTVQPVYEAAQAAHERGILFHTDAVQAAGHTAIDLSSGVIDMMSISGHKLHAPKGIGLLYIRKGVILENFMHGGAQEMGKRAGTENVAFAVGLARALEDRMSGMEEREASLLAEREYITERILSEIPASVLNGDRHRRAAGNMNFSFDGADGESLILLLDIEGVSCSSGSACASGAVNASHVLRAMGIDEKLAKCSLRLSFSEPIGRGACDMLCDAVKRSVEKIRRLSGWSSGAVCKKST